MVQVRKATLEDEAGVMGLMVELFQTGEITEDNPRDLIKAARTFREVIKDDELGTVLVAEEDGTSLGILTLSYPTAIRCGGIYTCIEEFVVSEKARGKGVGGQLLEAAIAEAHSKDCDEIQVNRPSEMGYPVYLRHGFQDLGKHLKMKPPRPAA